MFLSIIIPVYNEQNRIQSSLEKIMGYLKKKEFFYEIIIVDDGSSDESVFYVRKFIKFRSCPNINLLVNEKNRGKGFSVRRGVLEARGENILITDADFSTPVEELDKLIPWISKGYDIVIGSRGIDRRMINNQPPLFRILAGRIFCFLAKKIMAKELKEIKDTQCGFKLFKGGVAKSIFYKQKTTGFCFDVEILFIAERQGCRIKEIPVYWSYAPGSKVRLLKDSLYMLKELILIKRQSNLPRNMF